MTVDDSFASRFCALFGLLLKRSVRRVRFHFGDEVPDFGCRLGVTGRSERVGPDDVLEFALEVAQFPLETDEIDGVPELSENDNASNRAEIEGQVRIPFADRVRNSVRFDEVRQGRRVDSVRQPLEIERLEEIVDLADDVYEFRCRLRSVGRGLFERSLDSRRESIGEPLEVGLRRRLSHVIGTL